MVRPCIVKLVVDLVLFKTAENLSRTRDLTDVIIKGYISFAVQSTTLAAVCGNMCWRVVEPIYIRSAR